MYRLFYFLLIAVQCTQLLGQAGCNLINYATAATGTPYPAVVSFSFSSNCVAVLNDSDISLFSINPTTNQITKTTGPNPAGNYNIASVAASAIAFSPLGTILAAGSFQVELPTGAITLFKLNPSNCTLTQFAVIPIEVNPTAIAFSPDGRYLVSSNLTYAPSTLSVFSINCTTLEITKVPQAGPNGDLSTNINNPLSLAFSPNCSGCLALLDGGAVCTPTPGSISGVNGQILMYTLDQATGILTKIPSTEASGNYTTGVANGTTLAFSPTGSCLAVASSGLPAPICTPPIAATPGSVSLFSVSPTCTLTKIIGSDSAGNFPAGMQPYGLAFSPDGQCLAVSNMGNASDNSDISLFNFNSAECSITKVQGPNAAGNFNAGLAEAGIAYSPNGLYFGVANSTADSPTVTFLKTGMVSNSLFRFMQSKYCKPPCHPCI